MTYVPWQVSLFAQRNSTCRVVSPAGQADELLSSSIPNTDRTCEESIVEQRIVQTILVNCL
jgi:hypothetical protein